MNFISRLMPRQGRFFILFDGHAKLIVDGAVALAGVLRHYDVEKTRTAGIKLIEDAEHAADRITHETVQLLHTTFVTPFDREDIHTLISRMDDVLDLIQDAAESLVLYDIQKVTPEATQLAELVLRCAERVQAAVKLMVSMSDAPAMLGIVQEIDKLESEADRVKRGAISRLFREETDRDQARTWKHLPRPTHRFSTLPHSSRAILPRPFAAAASSPCRFSHLRDIPARQQPPIP